MQGEPNQDKGETTEREGRIIILSWVRVNNSQIE